MGWDFVLSCKTKNDIINRIVVDYPIIEHKVSGKEMWAIVKGNDNVPFLSVFLLEKDGNCWGYKGISEIEHPFYYNCPDSFIAKVPCPDNVQAKEWRTERLVYLSQKDATLSFKRRLQVGCRVKLTNGWILTVESVTPFVGRNADGKLYRIPKKMLTTEIL